MATNRASLRIKPRRQQAEEALVKIISSMEPGEQLPPEPSLARQLGISRATLREVMRTFVERGMLVRRHGVGTFVSSRIPALDTGLEVLESIDTIARRMGLKTEVAYLEIVERPATQVEAMGLERPDGCEVLVVTRVISVEGEPVADLRDVVPTLYLKAKDLGADFRGSVLDVLLNKPSLLLVTSKTQISVAMATRKFAQRLQVPEGSPLLKMTGQLYGYDDKVVAFSTSYFVPGHFQFHVMRKVSRR